MSPDPKDMTPDPKNRILDAALPHVAFDGWTEVTLAAAITDSGLPAGLARALFPRPVDLSLAFHHRGDRQMADTLAQRDLSTLRFRDRITLAVRLRLEGADREITRRGTALFALPQHAASGARAIWHTADAIWLALGDTSRDLNWYTKRMSLSAVYAATLLYWLGDETEAHTATWEFLDRRIEDVMRFEKTKASFRDNPFGKAAMAGLFKILERIHAPEQRHDLPGQS